MSMRDGFVNCAKLTIVVSFCRSFAYYNDTLMTGGSLVMAFRASP